MISRRTGATGGGGEGTGERENEKKEKFPKPEGKVQLPPHMFFFQMPDVKKFKTPR